MATEQLCAGLGSSHPWLRCKAFHPQGSLSLDQHVCTNVSDVFVALIPGNENDFVGATHSRVTSSYVDVVLGNWIRYFVDVIPGNDPAFGKS